MQMKTYTLIILIIIASSLWGSWDWATSLGGSGMSRIWDITSSTSSDILVCGDFTDSLRVHGSYLPGFGLADSFLISYGATGSLQWAKSWGSSDEDVALGVGVDASGASYVGGYFIGDLSFQGQSVSSNGMWDVYLMKLDTNGNLLWLRSFGGPMNDIGYGLVVNPNGQVFLTGWFADKIVFPGGYALASFGGSDVFCCSYSAAGEFLWAKNAGTAGVDYGYEIACDNDGNAYVTGVANINAQFGNFSLPTPGMFVAKYNAQGVEQWLASSVNAAVINIAVQAQSGPSQFGMVAGRIAGMGQIGSFAFSTVEGGDDAYWAAFDANTGVWINMQHYGGILADKGKDADCEFTPAYIANYEGQVSFGAIPFSSQGESDIILAYGPLDNLQFATAGGENIEISTSVKVLPNGLVAVAGWHFGLSQFGNQWLDSGSVSDQNAFLAVFNPASGVQDEQISSPLSLQLSPNPFADNLRIRQNKDGGTAALEVYNLKGQLVRSVSKPLSKGTESIYLWDGKDVQGRAVPAGVYLLKVGKHSAKAVKLP